MSNFVWECDLNSMSGPDLGLQAAMRKNIITCMLSIRLLLAKVLFVLFPVSIVTL